MSTLWSIGSQHAVQFPPLTGKVRSEAVVIGGGITGLLTAFELAERGRRVVVLEAARVGRGNSGRSTGNLYGTVSSGLAAVRRKWDADTTRRICAARMQAIARIEAIVQRFGIDCAFERRSLCSIVAAGDAQALQSLDAEVDANREAGLSTERVEQLDDWPLPMRAAMRIADQAQFNPLHFCERLATALRDLGVAIHEGSVVREVDAGRRWLRTDDGEVQADFIVHASHVPKGISLIQAQMEPYREYGIAVRLAADARYPHGIFWVRDEQRSVRSYRHGERQHLVVVGEKHKVGHGEHGHGYMQRLDAWARQHFAVASTDHEWSAQQYRPADLLPYIGPGAHANVLMATGFSADGLTWGAVASKVLADTIDGRDNPVAELLTPRRFTPIKSAGVWMSENSMVASHLVKDRMSAAPAGLSEVAPGEGRIVEINGRKHAVHRADDSTLTVLSPVCPHMKCHVAWNAAESSWDCPCHGSRFQPDGRVIEGPAMRPLEPVALDELHERRPAAAAVPAPRGQPGATR